MLRPQGKSYALYKSQPGPVVLSSVFLTYTCDPCDRMNTAPQNSEVSINSKMFTFNPPYVTQSYIYAYFQRLYAPLYLILRSDKDVEIIFIVASLN